MICPYLKSCPFWKYYWNLWLQRFIVKYTAARWPISEPHNSKVTVSLPRNAPEQNFESLLLFLFHLLEFQAVFLFCKILRNKNSKVCFYFCSTVRNSEHFSLPRNGSEQSSESFLFRGTAGISLEITICYFYFIFRRIIFCRNLPSLGMREGCGKEKTIFTYSSIPLMLKGKWWNHESNILK